LVVADQALAIGHHAGDRVFIQPQPQRAIGVAQLHGFTEGIDDVFGGIEQAGETRHVG
jgi:hypothetical protein